jgi:hypothetical protein
MTGLEITNEFRFKGLSGERVLMIGEMTVTEREQEAVIDALRRGEITAMHKHLRGERPRLWWMHVYAIGDPRQTARGLRSALDETATPDPPRRDDAARSTSTDGRSRSSSAATWRSRTERCTSASRIAATSVTPGRA